MTNMTTLQDTHAVAAKRSGEKANGPANSVKLSVKGLDFFYGDYRALKNISLDILENRVTAIIGPSGCGKSTLLRTLNRIYELYPGLRATGEILLDGENILSRKQDLNLLRVKVGMVFQAPTPFPMTIFDNIAFGIKLYETLDNRQLAERVEWALHKAALWDEVKDKLQAGADPARRTLLGPGSYLHLACGRFDRRAEKRLHHRHRHPQHAAGRTRLRLHGLYVPGRTDRVRRHQHDFHQTRQKGH